MVAAATAHPVSIAVKPLDCGCHVADGRAHATPAQLDGTNLWISLLNHNAYGPNRGLTPLAFVMGSHAADSLLMVLHKQLGPEVGALMWVTSAVTFCRLMCSSAEASEVGEVPRVGLSDAPRVLDLDARCAQA